MDDLDFGLAAFVLSVTLAVWQLTKHLLDGGRIRVSLKAGHLTDYRLSWAKTWKSMAEHDAGEGGWPMEVAVVDIENRGRIAVTIARPQLDIGRRWFKGRHSIGLHPLEAPDASTERKLRLEPFDDVRFVFDVWQGLAPSHRASTTTPKRPLRVRAVVQVAGKTRRVRSTWRRGWRVVPGQLTFLESNQEIGLVAHTSFWRHTPKDDVLGRAACIFAAIDVRERFPVDGANPSIEDLTEIFESHTFDDNHPEAREFIASRHMGMFYVHAELKPHYRVQTTARVHRA